MNRVELVNLGNLAKGQRMVVEFTPVSYSGGIYEVQRIVRSSRGYGPENEVSRVTVLKTYDAGKAEKAEKVVDLLRIAEMHPAVG